MPQRDLVLTNPCSSSFWLLIPSGTAEEFKGAGGHNQNVLCAMCCTQQPLSQIHPSLVFTPKFYYMRVPLNVKVTDCCFFCCDSSQSLGRGLRRGLGARPAPEEEAAAQSHHLHGGAAGGAGEGLRTHALSRHLHPGGAGSAGQTDGGSSSGSRRALNSYRDPIEIIMSIRHGQVSFGH